MDGPIRMEERPEAGRVRSIVTFQPSIDLDAADRPIPTCQLASGSEPSKSPSMILIGCQILSLLSNDRSMSSYHAVPELSFRTPKTILVASDATVPTISAEAHVSLMSGRR